MLDPHRSQLLAALRLALKTKQFSLSQISEATGVHTSQVSRILAGRIKRASPNVEKICKFAELAQLQQSSKGSEELLCIAVKNAWDGTAEHAMALVNLLGAIDSFQVAIRNSISKS